MSLSWVLNVEADAIPLRDGVWAVRPMGSLGTHGSHPVPWHVFYVTARCADEAVRKAETKAFKDMLRS